MLTAIVLTKNEEKNIKQCLDSLAFTDEVIIVDDDSTDKTREIAKKHKAKIFQRSLREDFAAQRNFGLEKTQGEWVLFVDADERISAELAREVERVITISNDLVNGYLLKRSDVMWGKELKHGEAGDIKLLRLGRKGKGEWMRNVHEIWEIKGKIHMLNSPLLHFPHPNLIEFIDSVNYYSTLDASWKLKNGIRSNIFKVTFWPLLKLVNNLVIKGGFRDGTEGFVVASMMSLHSFLSWGKLWLLQKK